MMSSIYLGVGALAAGVAISFYTKIKDPEPVAVDTKVVELLRYPDRVEVGLTWRNQRNCHFTSLSTMQGSADFPDELRAPIERKLGKPKGSRGIGSQATVDRWVFYRPADIFAPEFIMTSWHKCGTEIVPSKMLVIDIRDWFQEDPNAPLLEDPTISATPEG